MIFLALSIFFQLFQQTAPHDYSNKPHFLYLAITPSHFRISISSHKKQILQPVLQSGPALNAVLPELPSTVLAPVSSKRWCLLNFEDRGNYSFPQKSWSKEGEYTTTTRAAMCRQSHLNAQPPPSPLWLVPTQASSATGLAVVRKQPLDPLEGGP